MTRKLDFSGKILANGEAKGAHNSYPGMYPPGHKAPDRTPPGGFRAQTVNGTALYEGTGWNQDHQWDEPEARARGPWTETGNRTGE